MAIKASWIKTKVFLLVIMVTPLVLLVVLGSAKHNFFPLPVFVNEKDGSQIPMFPANVEFHDQQGIEINADFFNDQIVVVGYQFIDCKYKCTEAPRRLMKLQYEYRKATNVHMVQMIIGNKDKQTIDNFTTKYHIGDQWHVLTAPSVNGLRLGADVGSSVGFCVGLVVGSNVGSLVGSTLGSDVGSIDSIL